MKYRQINTLWRRLTATLLIGGVAPFLSMAHSQQKAPDGFKYPQSQETIQLDVEIQSRSLSGVVANPNGAGASKVLVERVRPGWGNESAQSLATHTGILRLPVFAQELIFLGLVNLDSILCCSRLE